VLPIVATMSAPATAAIARRQRAAPAAIALGALPIVVTVGVFDACQAVRVSETFPVVRTGGGRSEAMLRRLPQADLAVAVTHGTPRSDEAQSIGPDLAGAIAQAGVDCGRR
jgi:hypothetical protein